MTTVAASGVLEFSLVQLLQQISKHKGSKMRYIGKVLTKIGGFPKYCWEESGVGSCKLPTAKLQTPDSKVANSRQQIKLAAGKVVKGLLIATGKIVKQ
jgi:hypothetical protein